jgi:hypothetical protein
MRIRFQVREPPVPMVPGVFPFDDLVIRVDNLSTLRSRDHKSVPKHLPRGRAQTFDQSIGA